MLWETKVFLTQHADCRATDNNCSTITKALHSPRKSMATAKTINTRNGNWKIAHTLKRRQQKFNWNCHLNFLLRMRNRFVTFVRHVAYIIVLFISGVCVLFVFVFFYKTALSDTVMYGIPEKECQPQSNALRCGFCLY